MIEKVLAGVVVEGTEARQHPHRRHVVPAQADIDRPPGAGAEGILHVPGVHAERQSEHVARQGVTGAGAESRLGRPEVLASVRLVGEKTGLGIASAESQRVASCDALEVHRRDHVIFRPTEIAGLRRGGIPGDAERRQKVAPAELRKDAHQSGRARHVGTSRRRLIGEAHER